MILALSAAQPQLSQALPGFSAGNRQQKERKRERKKSPHWIPAAHMSQRQKPEPGMLIFRNSLQGCEFPGVHVNINPEYYQNWKAGRLEERLAIKFYSFKNVFSLIAVI